MFVGHCQYVRKSWHSRNRIRLNGRELWLSLPIKTAGQFEQSINDAEFADGVWRRKHLGSIRQAYQRTPYFDQYYPDLERLLLHKWSNLGEMDIALIRLIVGWLGIDTPLVDSRSYPVSGQKTDMLISMCRAVGADHYLSNEGSAVYVDEEKLAEAGIYHCWQKFEHPFYDQGAVFMPNMSVIDLVCCVGPGAGDVVRNCGKVSPGAFAPQLHT